MSDVTVSMKLSPKQAGALYVKAMRLEDEVKALRTEVSNLSNEAIHALAEIMQLKAERDALEAENAISRSLLKLARDEFIEANQDGETDCVTPYDLYDAGPEQCLREVQAEAGRAGFIAGRLYGLIPEHKQVMLSATGKAADQYAAKVRQGGAE